jgi:hypothetical protein
MAFFRDGGTDASWPHGKMVSLARSGEEANKEMMAVVDPQPPQGPQYPYGCCLRLDGDTMRKLGLDGEMPTAGDILEFYATAMVTCARVDPSSGEPCVELQITEMLPHEEESASEDRMEEEAAKSAGRRGRFYGESMGGYDRDIASYDGNRDAGERP